MQADNTSTDKTFFAALFDLSFTFFVTTKIIKVLFVLALIAIGLWSVAFLIAGLSQGGGAAFLALIGAPLFFFITAIYARVLLEFIAIVFRIAEHTAVIARNTSPVGDGTSWSGSVSANPPTAPPPPPGPEWGSPPPPSSPGQGW